MQRWVGSTINFSAPQVTKVAVKQSKKLHRKAEADHRVTIPEIIKSQYDPAIDRSFKVQLSPRFRNVDEKFILMDGKRKVGRQRIPAEFLKREAMLKKAVAGDSTSAE